MRIINEILYFFLLNFISIIVFISTSPIIDHIFGDIDNKKTNLRIIFEVIIQLSFLSLIFIIFHHYFNILVKDLRTIKLIRISNLDGIINKQIYFLILFCFIELQSNLKNKLRHLTKTHFIRGIFKESNQLLNN
jgi:hypothetical protein